MANPFFDHPILNSPYAYPVRHWELDDQGQPTHQIIESRRRAEFITPIPKPRKRKGTAAQQQMIFDEGRGLSTPEQQNEEGLFNVEYADVLGVPFDFTARPVVAHHSRHARPSRCKPCAPNAILWKSASHVCRGTASNCPRNG